MLALLLGSLLLYSGEIELPAGLYAPSGESFGPGKFAIELRRQGEDYRLNFLRGGKIAASIPSAPAGSAALNVPLAPTTLLWPPPPARKDEIRSKMSPYLANISWEAALRLYGSADPAIKEVCARVRAQGRNLEFPLSLGRPR